MLLLLLFWRQRRQLSREQVLHPPLMVWRERPPLRPRLLRRRRQRQLIRLWQLQLQLQRPHRHLHQWWHLCLHRSLRLPLYLHLFHRWHPSQWHRHQEQQSLPRQKQQQVTMTMKQIFLTILKSTEMTTLNDE